MLTKNANGNDISVRGVNVYYGTNHAVKDISMDIKQRKI